MHSYNNNIQQCCYGVYTALSIPLVIYDFLFLKHILKRKGNKNMEN
jgi:hypothetical protein